MLCQIANQIKDGIAQQVVRSDFFGNQAVHGRAELTGQIEQHWSVRRLVAQFQFDQSRQCQPTPRRFDSRRYIFGGQGIEERTQRFVEVEITDDNHARHQKATLPLCPEMADEGFGKGAAGTGARDQQRQPR